MCKVDSLTMKHKPHGVKGRGRRAATPIPVSNCQIYPVTVLPQFCRITYQRLLQVQLAWFCCQTCILFIYQVKQTPSLYISAVSFNLCLLWINCKNGIWKIFLNTENYVPYTLQIVKYSNLKEIWSFFENYFISKFHVLSTNWFLQLSVVVLGNLGMSLLLKIFLSFGWQVHDRNDTNVYYLSIMHDIHVALAPLTLQSTDVTLHVI